MAQLLQTTLIISLSLIFYKLLLEKETHYRLNRWMLLGCMLLAFILPQIPIKIPVPVELPVSTDISLPFSQKEIVYTPAWDPIDLPELAPEVLAESEEIAPIQARNSTSEPQPAAWQLFLLNLSVQDFLLYTYLLGAMAMFIHFLVQLVSLVHQIKIHPKSKEGKYVLVELHQGKASYSFFNFIFINPKPLDESTYQQILSHERIHVDQKHSFDILLSQLLLISQWFNPFAWLYKKKVKQNLEYLTDDLMVKQGTDITDYQFSLLRVSTPALSGQLVLNYSQSFLKKRILMMNAKKSSLSSVWKYLFLIPVLALSSLILVAEKAPTFPDQTTLIVEEQVALSDTPQQTEAFEQSPQDNVQDAEIDPEEISAPFLPLIFNQTEEIAGTWEGKLSDDDLCVRIFRSVSSEDWNWMNFDCYKKDDFSPTVTNTSTSFSLKRKAGSLDFSGSFSGIKGEGNFQFVGSDSYKRELAGKGIKKVSEDLLFRLFFIRHEEKFINNLVELQKLGLEEDILQTLMVDGVKADLVKGYQEENISISDNLSFVRSRVKANLLKSYQEAGLGLQDHKEFINSRVKPALLLSYKKAGLDLDKNKSFINGRVKPEMLTAYKDAGFDPEEYRSYVNSRVKPELLKEYQDAGFDLEEYRSYINSRVKPSLLTAYKGAGFDPSEYTSYIHSRVKPALLKSYQDAGLDLKENNSFIQSRVKPEVLKEYKDAGYDLGEYTSYIHSRVKPSLLKSYEDAGLDHKAYNSFIQSRVKPELLKEYKAAGFDPEQYTSFIHSRVKPSILKEYAENGFDVETHKSFIHSRVKPSMLKAYKDAGLDLEEHKTYIHSRVDAATLIAYKEAGFDLKTYDKYIHSRVKPSFLKAYADEGLDIKKYDKFVHSRVSAEFLKSYIDAGFEPMAHSEYIHRRIGASLLKRYKDAGLDIEEHKDFIMDRVSPEKVKKYRDAQKNKN